MIDFRGITTVDTPKHGRAGRPGRPHGNRIGREQHGCCYPSAGRDGQPYRQPHAKITNKIQSHPERWYEFDYDASFRSHVVYDDAGRKIVDDSIDEETMSFLVPDADESDPKTKEAIERYKKIGEPNICTILPALINEKEQEIDASDFFAETI